MQEKTFLNQLKEKRTSYRSMIEFCCESLILNNYIVEELSKKDLFSEVYCGSEISYYDSEGNEITEKEYYEMEDTSNCEDVWDDIYQYYIISESDAERLSQYTNELVIYYEELDLYILCVKHCGTSWDGVPANWKDEEEEEENNE